ncbi:MAG: YfhO family protein [Elusimicrobiota bacterium]|jgi:hypothetical protein
MSPAPQEGPLRTPRERLLLAGLLLAGVALLLVVWRRLLLEGLVPVDGNALTVAYPNWAVFKSSWPWRIPLWNGARGLGAPFAADPIAMALYPPLWLLSLAPDFAGFLRGWTVFHALVAAVFSGALGWRLTRERPAAFAAAALGALNAFFTARVVFPHCTAAAAWLPAVLYAQLALSPWGVAAALALGWLGGYPPFLIQTALLALVLAATQGREGLRCLAKGAALGAALSAAQWIPFLEFLLRSSRGTLLSAEAAVQFSVPPLQLLKELLLPQWYALRPAVEGDPAMAVFYIGPVALALCALAVLRGGRLERALAACGLAGLLLSLGAHLPGYSAFAPLRFFRSPSNWLLLAAAASAPLAALGVARLPRGRWLAAALVALDLAVFALPDRVAWARPGFFTDPPPLARRLAALPGPVRLHHSRALMTLWQQGTLEREEDYLLMRDYLAPAYGTALGVHDVSDCQTLRLRSADDYRRRLDEEGPGSPLLDWAGAAAWVSVSTGAARVERAALFVRPNPGYRGRVFAQPASAARAALAAWRPGRAWARVEGAEESLVVLGESDYPGWEAYVDGEPRRIERFEGFFPGVRVGAGAHRVEFRFRSPGLIAGLALALFVLSLALVRKLRAPSV